MMFITLSIILCFFFNDPATTEIYTLSLHDALPISEPGPADLVNIATYARTLADLAYRALGDAAADGQGRRTEVSATDRKSTRLNSSHLGISYAVFCLKKKKLKEKRHTLTD